MKSIPVDIDKLTSSLCGFPGIRRVPMTTRELREVLLNVPRPFFLHGRPYDIKSERVGPGVYDVYLKERP